mgnify:CR=1 FL=1
MFNDKEPGAVQATRVADPGGEDPDPDPILEKPPAPTGSGTLPVWGSRTRTTLESQANLNHVLGSL